MDNTETEETFKEALYNNIQALQDFEKTKLEIRKLIDNINNYIPIKKYLDIPKQFLKDIEQFLSNPHKYDIFMKNQQLGGSSYQYIYEPISKIRYKSNSIQGKTILLQFLKQNLQQFLNDL